MKGANRILCLCVVASACLVDPAAHAQLVVATTADEDDGNALPGNGAGTSLREATKYARPGDAITFAPVLSGQTISITNGLIPITKSVSIDGSALADGVTLHGHGRNGLFHCGSQTTNTLVGLTLTGGRTTQAGGAILNDSVLTVNDCTFAGNIANEGGAIFQFESVTLNNCTIVSNYARFGGGIENDGFRGALTLNNCTLAHNVATNDGGAILNMFTTVLNNCTVVSNRAFWGGGISNCDTLFLTNSIVAANAAGSRGTEQIAGSIDGAGAINLVSSDAMLAPLGDYGGPTQTMPPLPGSPAIDPIGSPAHSEFTTDQRGLPRTVGGRVDVGATEFQGISDIVIFWPADWDGDGNPFGVELALGLNPLVPDAGGQGTPSPYPPAAGNGIEFGLNRAATNYAAWVVKRSLDLSAANSFVEIYRFDGPTGISTTNAPVKVDPTTAALRLTDTEVPRPAQAFYQLIIEARP